MPSLGGAASVPNSCSVRCTGAMIGSPFESLSRSTETPPECWHDERACGRRAAGAMTDLDGECEHGLTGLTCSICASRGRRAAEHEPLKNNSDPPQAAPSPAVVWVTRIGQCFHADPACPALRSGQELAARRGRHYSTPEIRRISPVVAVAERRMVPCSRCIVIDRTKEPSRHKPGAPSAPNDNFCLGCLRRLRRGALRCPTCGNASIEFVQRHETP